MTFDVIFVFSLIGLTAMLMASNRVRYDIVALLVVLALMLSGVLTVGEAISGFGSPVVILVACLLVVGEMLDRTGVARAVGDVILKYGGTSETRLLIYIMLAAALLGGVMSSTAIVAIFIPIVLRIAAETNLNKSRLLMPMSYAALISGMLTLIATTPNIVMHEELKDAGLDGFGFFSFMPLGLAVLAIAIGYLLLVGRKLLPGDADTPACGQGERKINVLWKDFQVGKSLEWLRIGVDSPLVGETIGQSELESRFGLRVIGIQRPLRRGQDRLAAPSSETELHAEDVLLAVGETGLDENRYDDMKLTPASITDRDRQQWLWEMGGAAVLVHPESKLIGKSLRTCTFRSTYGLHVLGMRRGNKPVAPYADAKLHAADSLFVVGPWEKIDQLQSSSHDFVVTELPRERTEVVKAYRKMPVALVILVLMVLLTLFNIVPLVAAVIMAALAAVFTRCLTMEDAYRSIHWSSVVLVAGMLPLAKALDQTGGTDLVVKAMMSVVGDAGPRMMLTAVFFITAILSLFLSNTASAVLVAPIAIYVARALDVSPYPFAVAVVIAASAAFSTPVSSPVVTLVVEPGRYKFMDFVKVGVPLLLLTFLVTILLAPIIFPFSGFEWPVEEATHAAAP
ncbi:MAG: SLC13 family permease [Planctomycetota bacterium]|nr:SLC13 family permease [Planctomycetota bacterium]